MHVLVILPRWVGDAAMATPLLRAVRGHFQGARITGVMRGVVADLLTGTGWIDDVVAYDRTRSRTQPHLGFRAVARRLRSDRADVALILPNSLSSAALAWAGGARRRVGHAGHRRRLLLTDVVAPTGGGPLPPPRRFLQIAQAVGVSVDASADLELATTPADEALAEAVLAERFAGMHGEPGPLVILNDNGAHGPARSWGVDKCAALARWLTPRLPGCRILVHCGPDDRAAARAVATQAGLPSVESLADVPSLPIGLSKALYRRAALSITSDSGPRHIAAAFGVPTVALVGPIDPICGRSDPVRCVELRLPLSCAPCGRRACPLGHHDCMRLIMPDQVGRAALELLELWPARAAPNGLERGGPAARRILNASAADPAACP
jgi:heptosyltransferase-2